MMRLRKIVQLFFAGGVLFTSCREAYEPQIIEAKNHYLVIEGTLNNGGPTSIRLSRTRPLGESVPRPELKAIVSIESQGNQSFLLSEKGGGDYVIQLSLDPAEKYRLRIKTADKNEYLSDFVSVKNTPPIDDVTWEMKNDGVQIYVNTHDPQNNTRYYRWEYEETWQNRPPMISILEYVNGSIQGRKVPLPQICWASGVTNQILLGTTAKLTKDVVSQAPVNFIPPLSQKLADRYSILVKQYALEEKAYEYWLNMKKNTEQLGSIFDPQPSYMYGNIRSVSDPKEMVIGFFGVCNITEKRIYIEIPWRYSSGCPADVVTSEIMERIITGMYVPMYYGPELYATRSGCQLCTGSSVKPIFWQ